MKTIVGMFDSYTSAQQAATELEALGFTDTDVSMLTSVRTRDAIVPDDADLRAAVHPDTGERVGIGAGVGATLGGLAGLLVGIGALAIPGIGPLVAAGPIVAALTGAGFGAATGGLVGGLTALGVPPEHAAFYAEGIRRGGTLLTVRADDARAQQVADVLARFGAVDVDKQAARWQRDANDFRWSDDTAKAEDERRIPIYEEDVQIGKRAVESGGVRVTSKVVETPVTEEVTLREEHVRVDRRPADRPVDPSALDAVGGTVEFAERSEEVVVDKTARVVEEVVISKDVDQHVEKVTETARRTDVQVEQLPTGRAARSGFDAYDQDFRTNWQSSYASTGGTYETMRPAYQYGYELASDASYREREWDDIEPHIRHHWETQRPGTWDQMKGAVRHAWDRVRGRTPERI
jgi:stress response protein YsnF